MRFTASWVEGRRCGRPDLSGKVCLFEGRVRVDQIDDGPTLWTCPRCRRGHRSDSGRVGGGGEQA